MREAGRPHLLLFTGVFPYGRGEAFLEPEIEYLARDFERVTVVPRHASGIARPLPPNVTTDDSLAELHRPRGRRNRPRAFARCLTSRHLYTEVLKRPATLVQPAAADHLIGHLAAALRMKQWLEQRIADGTVNPGSTTAYCYWLWAEAVGAGMVREKHPELRVIARAHGFDLYQERHRPPYIALQQFAVQHADRVLAVSENGRHHLATRYPRYAGQVDVARLGTAHPEGESRPSSDGVLRVLTCSRLEEVKRPELMVRALAAFAARWPEQRVEWTHFGSGVLMETVSTMACELLPESVQWSLPGEMPNARVREHYLRSPVDLLLSTSSSEGVPVSMMEAQSFGVPVVATAVGGVPEIIGHDTGVLVPADASPADLAEAMHGFVPRGGGAAGAEVMRMRDAARRQWREHYRADTNFPAFVSLLRG